MLEQAQEGDRPLLHSAAPPSSRWNWIVFVAIGCSVFLAARIGPIWWTGRAIHPLALAGQTAWMVALFGVLCRRKLRNRESNDSRFPWYRFSLGEMFVIGTGIALFIGLTGADYQQGLRTQRERDRLRSNASEFLGPDGRLDFELDGTMAVIVCDRSFDDQRFTKLANLLDDFSASDGVTRVLFGTSAGMRATPAHWPGITDASVDVLLRWQKTLRAVAIQGTAITPAGIKCLSMLPELDVSYPSRELQKHKK